MRKQILSKLTHSLIVVLTLTCLGLYGSMAGDDSGPRRTLAASSPADLVAAHGCWVGDAPRDMAGKTPGRVVVTVHGEARYAGSWMVARALEQVYEGVDHGLTVHAFCR